MFLAKWFYFLLLLSNNTRNYLSSNNDSLYIKKSNTGIDERYIKNDENICENCNNNDNNEDGNIYMLYKIDRFFIIKNIVEELEKNTTNVYKKLDIIEKYTDIYKEQNSIREFNLFAGNLLENF
jgi:hypothetical protein